MAPPPSLAEHEMKLQSSITILLFFSVSNICRVCQCVSMCAYASVRDKNVILISLYIIIMPMLGYNSCAYSVFPLPLLYLRELLSIKACERVPP